MNSQALHSLGNAVGVIPAHLESQRLPRKALRPICGHPMIAWVYQRARSARCLDRLVVATDSEEIFAYCRANDLAVTMTSKAHRSGTERLAEVMMREGVSSAMGDLYVNIQADEPMITAEHIELLLRPFHDGTDAQVSTLKVAIGLEQARDPNNVKVVTDLEGRALYFSRTAIPSERGGEPDAFGRARYYKHLGIYAYTAAALEKFRALQPSPLEQQEKLEQLRFLENGIPIVVVETYQDTIGVDTEEDLQKVEEYFRQAGITLDQRDRFAPPATSPR